MIELDAADLYCGAGGATSGAMRAAKELGIKLNLVAVNHWARAIETHSSNHPDVRHFCEDTETLNPRLAVPSGHLHLLITAPECTGLSVARGGKPINDQSRATAWHVLRWAEALDIDNILIENVRQFRDWGPLYPLDHPDVKLRNRPIPAQKGRLYRLFLQGLRALGYTVSDRILNAADYGDATTRHRLFIQARKGTKQPVWPDPTHLKSDGLGMYPGAKPWRSAREIIDWSLPGQSIYTRKRPLAPATMRRILAGLQKFAGLPFIVPQMRSHDTSGRYQYVRSVDDPLNTITTTSSGVGLCQPFLVVLRNNCAGASIDEPIPTVCAGGNQVGVAEPFLVNMKGRSNAADIDKPTPTQTAQPHLYLAEPFLMPVTHKGPGRGSDIDEPVPTITTAHRGEQALVEPFIMVNRSHNQPHSVEDPLHTLTTGGNMALVEPFLVGAGGPEGQGRNPKSFDEPLGTVLGENHQAVCEPFLVPFFGEAQGQKPRTHSTEEPLPAVTGHGAGGLVEAYLIPCHGQKPGEKSRARSVDQPLSTIDTSNRIGLARPYLVNYYGNGQAFGIDDPLPTVDTRDRYALVSPEFVELGLIDKADVIGYLDIRFRMLKPHELAAAHSFPLDYHFAGNGDEKVRQIGNSWGVGQGEALCRAILAQYVPPASNRKRGSKREV